MDRDRHRENHADRHRPAEPDAIDWAGVVHQAGTAAARPAASALNKGCLYYASDTQILYRSDGATWTQIAPTASGDSPWELVDDPMASYGGHYVKLADPGPSVGLVASVPFSLADNFDPEIFLALGTDDYDGGGSDVASYLQMYTYNIGGIQGADLFLHAAFDLFLEGNDDIFIGGGSPSYGVRGWDSIFDLGRDIFIGNDEMRDVFIDGGRYVFIDSAVGGMKDGSFIGGTFMTSSIASGATLFAYGMDVDHGLTYWTADQIGDVVPGVDVPSGDVMYLGVEGGDLHLQSEGGGINLETAGGGIDLFSTSGASIRNRLSGGDFIVDASWSNGSGGAGGDIRLFTDGGNIEIETGHTSGAGAISLYSPDQIELTTGTGDIFIDTLTGGAVQILPDGDAFMQAYDGGVVIKAGHGGSSVVAGDIRLIPDSGRYLSIANLPTSDPAVADALWVDGLGFVHQSP